jgi:hypothetical protein
MLTLEGFMLIFEELMTDGKKSFHERFVTMLVAAIMVAIFIKILFF